MQDLNDNSPTIQVNALTAAGYAEIDENLPRRSFVAHVSVTDLDTAAGGQVRSHKHFMAIFSFTCIINLYFAIWQHKQTNKQKKCTEKQSNTQELYTRKINETELHI